ncbi:MAG TPA: hypothetical protein VGK46_05125 [Saprospiraceae bacterium]
MEFDQGIARKNIQMKKKSPLLFLVVLICLVTTVNAQVDSVRDEVHKLRPDSIRLALKDSQDSLTILLMSLEHAKEKRSGRFNELEMPDSVLNTRGLVNVYQINLNASRADSVIREVDLLSKSRYDRIQKSVLGRMDSLNILTAYDTIMLSKLRKPKTHFDSAKNVLNESKLSLISGKASDRINQNTPAINFPPTDMPGIEIDQPMAAGVIPDYGEIPIDQIHLPEKINPTVSTQLDLPNVATPSIEGVNLASPGLPEFSTADNLSLDDLSVKNLENKKIEEAVEEKLMGTEELGQVSEQIDEADRIRRYYDPEVAKEEVLNNAKEQAVNHFAGREDALKVAMEELSKLKQKFPHPEGAVDMFAKRQKFLRGTPFIERLIPGICLQVQKIQFPSVDISPSLTVKLAPRFQTGFMWSERLAYNTSENTWDKTIRVYGPRWYLNFMLKNRLYARGEIEYMNVPVESTQRSTEINGRQWVPGFLLGLKKDFEFSSRVHGNIQTLYGLSKDITKNVMLNRFSIRLGVEFPLRKRNQNKAD